MRALAVEFARLWHRRAVGLLVVLGILGVLTTLGFAFASANPPSASDRAVAQQQADRQAQDPMYLKQLKDCQAAQHNTTATEEGQQGSTGDGSAGASTEPTPGSEAGVQSGFDQVFPPGMDCDELTPKAEWFLNWSPPDFVRDYHAHLQAATMLLALVLVLAGITFAGADWNQGTFGTQLVYQPRRSIVFTSKAVALAALAVVVGAIGAASAWVESYIAAARWGTTTLVEQVQHRIVTNAGTGMGTEQVPTSMAHLFGEAMRATSIVALAALGGYILAMIFRSSLVDTAILAAYGIVGEAVLSNLFHGIAPYMLSSRLLAWMAGPYQLRQWPTGNCGGPTGCEPTITTITVAGGGIYLAILLAAGLTIAAWTFTRRDVN